MPVYVVTIRVVTAARTVEPGGSIEPRELEPQAWAGLVRRGCIVEGADELVVGQMAPADTPHHPLTEGDWPGDVEQRLAGLPASAKAALATVDDAEASADP